MVAFRARTLELVDVGLNSGCVPWANYLAALHLDHHMSGEGLSPDCHSFQF